MSKNTYFKWSEEKDNELIRQLLRSGKVWAEIILQAFPGMNEKQLSNRYYYLRERLSVKTKERIDQKMGENQRRNVKLALLLSRMLLDRQQ